MESNSLIEKLNRKFGTNFNKADNLSIEYIIAELLSNEKLRNMAKINKIEDFKFAFYRIFLDSVVDKFKHNSFFFRKIMDDKDFKNALMEYLLPETYKKLKISE